MANKKKSTAELSAKFEEAAPIEPELEGQETTPADGKSVTKPEQEAAPADDESVTELEQVTTPANDETATETEQEAPTTEESESTGPVTKEMQCPFEATVAVPIAILRKSIGPGTAEMLKPVATLKQGTKITITDIHGNNARLANGLWIALEYTTR